MKTLLLSSFILISSCAPSLQQTSQPDSQVQHLTEAGVLTHLQSDLVDDSTAERTIASDGDDSTEQFIDPRCERTGCSGEVCQVPAIEEEDVQNGLCEYHEYYACFSIPSCTVKEDSCGWETSPEFLSCLKQNQAPFDLINKYSGEHVVDLINQANAVL